MRFLLSIYPIDQDNIINVPYQSSKAQNYPQMQVKSAFTHFIPHFFLPKKQEDGSWKANNSSLLDYS